MIITFDKGTKTERSIPMTFFNEQPFSGKMTCNNSIEITPETVLPDLSKFKENPNFLTIECVGKNGTVIPLVGSYSKITALNANYSDNESIYDIGMTIE